MEPRLSGLPYETKQRTDSISGWISDQPKMNPLPSNLEHLSKSKHKHNTQVISRPFSLTLYKTP